MCAAKNFMIKETKFPTFEINYKIKKGKFV